MVRLKKRPVEWTLMAKQDFKEILIYYRKRSLPGYLLVKSAVLKVIDEISVSPHIFKMDNLKTPKDERVRTFTVYHTRVAYFITDSKIIILRLRHTSREPLEF